MEHRKQKIAGVIREQLSQFIESESNRQSMITITNVIVDDGFKSTTIFVTVFPERSENAALDFLKRQRSEARNYLKKHSRLARIPHIDFALDKGEKARQRIEEISSEIRSE